MAPRSRIGGLGGARTGKQFEARSRGPVTSSARGCGSEGAVRHCCRGRGRQCGSDHPDETLRAREMDQQPRRQILPVSLNL